MSRQQTPISQAIASGAKDKNPKRFEGRLAAPAPNPVLGPPPPHLPPEQIPLWHEVVERTAPGVLTAADRFIVEIIVGLLEKQRGGFIKPVEIGHLRAALGSLGLTPADRSRVNGSDEPKKEEDPLAALFGAKPFGHLAN